MIKRSHSENASIALWVLPSLHEDYGYPEPKYNHDEIKINDVPVFNAQGKVMGNIDILYYKDGDPLLLIEAKKEHKSHEDAKKQALFYLTNFPKSKIEYCKSGRTPKFFATTVGKEIQFYKRQYNTKYDDYEAIEIDDLSYNQLLKELGLSKGYKSRVIHPDNFKADFFDDLIDVFRQRKGIITRDVVEKIVTLIYNYLIYSDRFTNEYPYHSLSSQKKKWILDLFKRFDFIKSLSPELAKEFRKCVTRAFQGEEFNQYITDHSIIEFMCALVGKLKPSSKILDFECGSGGFLAEAVSKWKLSLRSIKGIDIDELPYLISKTYLAIYFKKRGKSVDTIPVSMDNGLYNYGNKYDLVIGNPAGSNEYKHKNEKRIIEEGLQDLRGNSDSFKEYDLSVQQAVRSCKSGGKICLILPDGFFSNSRDNYLRKLVSGNSKVKAIVSLPKGAFKRGHDTKIKGKGASTANMKMSILCCEKYPESKKKPSDAYPVFLTSIFEPSSTKGEISEWLKEPLGFIKEQFLYWHSRKKLKNIKKSKVKILLRK